MYKRQLRAISGKEPKVKEYLEADLKNSDLGEYAVSYTHLNSCNFLSTLSSVSLPEGTASSNHLRNLTSAHR